MGIAQFCFIILLGRAILRVVLKTALPFLLLSAVAISVSAQDPLKRMDPDIWLTRPAVEAMREWAREHDSASSLTVSSGEGALHAPLGSNAQLLLRAGDLRVVLDSSRVNRSVSHNLGFNLSAKDLTFKNRTYSLGGRGFWDAHAKLIEFIEKTGEWELVTMENGPHSVTERGSFFDRENGKVYAIDEGKWGLAAQEKRVVWELDLEALRWERSGAVNSRFQLFVQGVSEMHDLEDFALWVGSHQAAILRKSDGKAVKTNRWNQMELASVRAQMVEADLSMLVVDGNRLQAFVQGQDAPEVKILDWDVESAFLEESAQSVLVDWVLPMEETETLDSWEARESGGQKANLPAMMWGVVLVVCAGAAFLMGRQSGTMEAGAVEGNRPKTEFLGEERDNGKDTGHSPAAILHRIETLEQAGPRIMSTEEVNQFLDLAGDLSSESRRAKRAQFIRDVNRVYQMRHGKDMIVREKDLNDRRRTIYVIHPRSGTA